MQILNKFIKIFCGILILILVCILGFYIAQRIRVFGTTSTELINPQTQSFDEIIDNSTEITIEKKIFSFKKSVIFVFLFSLKTRRSSSSW